MKLNRKTTACLILCLAALLIFTACKPKSYGNFKVVQSKAVSGDYIILPDMTADENGKLIINTDKSFHFPLVLYKAIETRLSDIAAKVNDFSTGITETEAEKLYDLIFDDYGAGLITDEKQKSAYYAIVTDLTTKQDAKNAEASAILNETSTFTDMLYSVMEVYLDTLVDIRDFANKQDTSTLYHEDLFTDDVAIASEVMAVWFPSVKFISSFADMTGTYITNPWIPDWEQLLSDMNDLNNDYAETLLIIDSYDPDEIDELMDEADDVYDELYDIWLKLPCIEEYEDRYEALTDKYDVIKNKANDMWEDAYDAYWDSYWSYNWW